MPQLHRRNIARFSIRGQEYKTKSPKYRLELDEDVNILFVTLAGDSDIFGGLAHTNNELRAVDILYTSDGTLTGTKWYRLRGDFRIDHTFIEHDDDNYDNACFQLVMSGTTPVNFNLE